MVGIGQRLSTLSQNSGSKSGGGGGSRPSSKDGKKNIWSSMLDSVASGKRLPEKNMIVLGLSFLTCPLRNATP
jgi:dynein light intermediate chain 1